MPTTKPSCVPSAYPSAQPSDTPSSSPTTIPTSLPSSNPTTLPTSQPTCHPSGAPTACPSSAPSGSPSSLPSQQPSSSPSSRPSVLPTSIPSCRPSTQPTSKPTSQPTDQPTSYPTSMMPSSLPTARPSAKPTSQPSSQPTAQPFSFPTSIPSQQPASRPSSPPTSQPSSTPTLEPTVHRPTVSPTEQFLPVMTVTAYYVFGNVTGNMTDDTKRLLVQLQSVYSLIPAKYIQYYGDYTVSSGNQTSDFRAAIELLSKDNLARHLQAASNDDDSVMYNTSTSVIIAITKTNLNLVNFPQYSDTNALFQDIKQSMEQAVISTDSFQDALRNSANTMNLMEFHNVTNKLIYFEKPEVELPFSGGLDRKKRSRTNTVPMTPGVLSAIIICSVIGGLCCCCCLYLLLVCLRRRHQKRKEEEEAKEKEEVDGIAPVDVGIEYNDEEEAAAGGGEVFDSFDAAVLGADA